ncbi:hypothetical protein D9M71_618090 [compost metagenome]
MGGEAGLDTKAWQGMGQQVISAAIELGHRNNVVTGLGHGLDGIGNGRHARRYRQGTDPAFKGGHTLFEHIIGRVHDAAVDVAGHLQVKQVGTVLGVIEGERSGLVDRYGHGLGGGVGTEARVDGQGFQLHAIVP